MKRSRYPICTAGLCLAFDLAAPASAQFGLAAPTSAQSAIPPSIIGGALKKAAQTREASTIVVVGSRLRRTHDDSGAPITIISAQDQLDEGKTTATAVLQSNAVTGGNNQVNNAYSGYAVDGGPGVNTTGLRGLGATRTLILLNGRRLSPAGVQGGVSAVDLNTLPPQIIIDRYEVLRDGASSIYGSDAVAGVINVVTRKKMSGLTMFGANAMTQNGAGSRQTLDIATGYTGARFHLTAAFGYYRQNALLAADAPWAQCQTDGFAPGQDTIDPRTGKPKCYPITGTGDNGVTINTIGTASRAGIGALGATGTVFNRWRANPAVTTGLIGWEGVGGGTTANNVRDTFDPRMLQTPAISPADIYRGFIAASYDLQALGDAELYGSGLFSDRESSQNSYRQLIIDYPKGSPLIPAELQFSTFLPLGGSLMNPTTATGVRAFVGYGMTGYSQSVRQYRIDGGIRGRTGIGDWRYDFYASHSLSQGYYNQQQFLTDRMAKSAYVVANGSGGYACADPSGGCVAMPALNAATVAGNLPAAWMNYVTQWVRGYTGFATTTAAASFDGTLAKLPYGAMKGALGLEYAAMRLDDAPALDAITGNLYTSSTSAYTRGWDRMISAYAETETPLLRNLRVNLSGRWNHYRSYGDGWTYKANGQYAPVNGLMLRATYGTSFRAPSLKEQFQGATSGFISSAVDPCNGYNASSAAVLQRNCAAAGLASDYLQTNSVRVNTLGGASAGLKAETSSNLTLGAVVQPDLGKGGAITFSVDYYRITIRNAVDRAGAAYVLNSCYNDPNFGTNQALYCRLVTRNAKTGALTVNDSSINIASQKVSGFDFQLRYTAKIGKARLILNGIATRYTSQTYQQFPDQVPTEYNGSVRYPQWTGDLSGRLDMGKASLFYRVSYVQGQNSDDLLGTSGSKYQLRTPDYVLHNASVRFKLPRFDLVLGMDNIFNTNPPTISSGYYSRVGNAALYSGYDFYGRSLYANVTARF